MTQPVAPAAPAGTNDFTWQTETNRYRGSDGRFIPNSTVTDWRNTFLDNRQGAVRDLTAALDAGWVTINDWQSQLAEIQRETFGALAALGRGGVNAMQPADWQRVNNQLLAQQPHLTRFASDIWRGNLSVAQINARSDQYVGSAVQAFEGARAAAWGDPDLPMLPGDGNTECNGNCRCAWEILTAPDGWDCYWNGTSDERTCMGCETAQSEYAPLFIPYPDQANLGPAVPPPDERGPSEYAPPSEDEQGAPQTTEQMAASAEMVRQVLADRDAGLTLAQLATKHGTSTSSIRRILFYNPPGGAPPAAPTPVERPLPRAVVPPPRVVRPEAPWPGGYVHGQQVQLYGKGPVFTLVGYDKRADQWQLQHPTTGKVVGYPIESIFRYTPPKPETPIETPVSGRDLLKTITTTAAKAGWRITVGGDEYFVKGTLTHSEMIDVVRRAYGDRYTGMRIYTTGEKRGQWTLDTVVTPTPRVARPAPEPLLPGGFRPGDAVMVGRTRLIADRYDPHLQAWELRNPLTGKTDRYLHTDMKLATMPTLPHERPGATPIEPPVERPVERPVTPPVDIWKPIPVAPPADSREALIASVVADRLAGMGPTALVAKYKLPMSTIRGWLIKAAAAPVPIPKERPVPKVALPRAESPEARAARAIGDAEIARKAAAEGTRIPQPTRIGEVGVMTGEQARLTIIKLYADSELRLEALGKEVRLAKLDEDNAFNRWITKDTKEATRTRTEELANVAAAHTRWEAAVKAVADEKEGVLKAWHEVLFHAEAATPVVIWSDRDLHPTGSPTQIAVVEDAVKRINTGIADWAKIIGPGHMDGRVVKMELERGSNGLPVKGRSGYSYNNWESPKDGTVSMSINSKVQVVVHELFHWTEHSSDHFAARTETEFNSRTAGQQPQDLNLITGMGYRPDEVAIPDAFLDPYMGKVYSARRDGRSHELLTMSTEYLYAEPLRFAKYDAASFRYAWEAVHPRIEAAAPEPAPTLTPPPPVEAPPNMRVIDFKTRSSPAAAEYTKYLADHLNQLDALARTSGYRRGYAQAMDSVAHEVVKDSVVAMRIPDEVLPSLLKSDQFLNQFDSNTTTTVNADAKERATVEAHYFGIPLTAGSADRPLYGYVANADAPQGAAHLSNYGNTTIVFKDSVKDRTTVTGSDSSFAHNTFQGQQMALPFNQVDGRIFTADVRELKSTGTLDLRRPNDAYTYIEAQIHPGVGGLRLADIDHIILPTKPTADMMRQLKTAGVKYTVSRPVQMRDYGRPGAPHTTPTLEGIKAADYFGGGVSRPGSAAVQAQADKLIGALAEKYGVPKPAVLSFKTSDRSVRGRFFQPRTTRSGKPTIHVLWVTRAEEGGMRDTVAHEFQHYLDWTNGVASPHDDHRVGFEADVAAVARNLDALTFAAPTREQPPTVRERVDAAIGKPSVADVAGEDAVRDNGRIVPPDMPEGAAARESRLVTTVRAVKAKAWTGPPVPQVATIGKQAQGRLGERIVMAYFRQVVGLPGIVPANAKQSNYPVDMFFKGGAIEVKAGLISNLKSSQQWRVTLGETGQAEKDYMKTLSSTALRAYNEARETAAIDRKLAVMKELTKLAKGKKQEALTATVILNLDNQTADIYVFDGFHKKIGWNEPDVQGAYVGTYKWSEK